MYQQIGGACLPDVSSLEETGFLYRQVPSLSSLGYTLPNAPAPFPGSSLFLLSLAEL